LFYQPGAAGRDPAALAFSGVGWLVVFPVILIAGAALVSWLFVRRSSVRITSEGVEIRNYPQDIKVVPLDAVDRFVETERSGTFKSLRPATATLVLLDGTRVPVRSLGDGAVFGVDALNDRVAALRAGP
jgi:hypothetical protein